MTIEDLLKDKSLDIRLTHGTAWLVWYENEWLVLNRPFGKKANRCLYSGLNLQLALEALVDI